MVFSSLSFLFVFLPALLAVYWCPGLGRRETRNTVLLVFSLFFYGCGGWRLLPLILLSIAGNYGFGLLAGPPHAPVVRRRACAGAVACNLGLLFCFKYLNFLSDNLRLLFPSLPELAIVLPIGISFYTFQSLSYVIDVYRGDVPPERNPLHVALYVALFPQLVAGPIVRYSTVAEEIVCRRETVEDAALGARRFLFGLAKKVLLANQMGQIADAAFRQSAPLLSAGLAWLGVAGYTLQIYFDFSGYSDMAIGLGRMFGFHFLENFNYPYVSRSVTEFWRRWHISLSTWFRDYLYIPLGGSRCSRGKQLRNLLIVWALTGFWHGAAWNFLLWGLYYALLLIGERYVWGQALERLPSPVRHLLTLLAVALGWLLFRASGAQQISQFLRAMAGAGQGGLWSGQVTYLLLQFRWELLIALAAALPVKPALQRALEARRDTSRISAAALDYGASALALALGALSVLSLVNSGFNPFIYFQF
jgi:alginate O-acetyltransferase complex protein AlgI